MTGRIQSFPPLIGSTPTVLILGSMPGKLSLELGQYYGHPRNHFWRIIFTLLRRQTPHDYQEKTQELKNAGIALWDVIADCRRDGSLDQAIREERYNDVWSLVLDHPSLQLIAFNGTMAERGFYRGVKSLHGIDIGKSKPKQKGKPLVTGPKGKTEGMIPGCRMIRLPSTSPVPTRYYKNYESKIEAWRVIEPCLA